MTLKNWLKVNRQPEYSGINARAVLKMYAAKPTRSLRATMLDMAISFGPEIKHTVYRMHLKRAQQ